LTRLRCLLADDVTVHADGGGKMPTTDHPVVGVENVLRLHASLARVFAQTMSRLLHYGFISGLPGFVTMEQQTTLQTTAFEIDGDRVAAIYVVRNPEKLQHLQHRWLQ
jgi:RNA polymerase sigma-70 factor (ECF subfamily)